MQDEAQPSNTARIVRQPQALRGLTLLSCRANGHIIHTMVPLTAADARPDGGLPAPNRFAEPGLTRI